MNVHRAIRAKFHIHNNDTPPYIGWGITYRKDLALLFAELGYTYGAEIGVANGQNAKMFFQCIPDLSLICVDPWMPFGRNNEKHMERVYDRAKKRLDGRNVIWKRTTSEDGAREVENESLDFVYIDALHDFDNVMADIIRWTPKVHSKGIVSGHDYVFAPREGVISAVDAYVKAHGVNLYLTKDRKECNSWFFVK